MVYDELFEVREHLFPFSRIRLVGSMHSYTSYIAGTSRGGLGKADRVKKEDRISAVPLLLMPSFPGLD